MLDTFSLARAGYYEPEKLLRLLAACRNETSAPVWSAISSVLLGLDKVLLGSGLAMHKYFVAFTANLVGPAVAQVGWTPAAEDQHRTRLLRSTLLNLAARFVSTPAFLHGAWRPFA